MAAPTAIDLTNSGHFTEFSGSSPEDISYAKTFWQSVQLQPPMESRLVSSDIKQRLRVAPSGIHTVNHSTYTCSKIWYITSSYNLKISEVPSPLVAVGCFVVHPLALVYRPWGHKS